MDKEKLANTFEKIKAATKMDYAITNADDYGDCSTCVNSELAVGFGENSTGIFTKVWETGMNKGKPWEELDCVDICHDLEEAQANVMVEMLNKAGYDVEPTKYDPSVCFTVTEKDK